MAMLNGPIADLTEADLLRLCTQGALEDEQIDFKVTIPHREGQGQDPWRNNEDGRRTIKPHGRDQLLSTIVAFANSYGGDLVIGLREVQGTQPGRAEALDPLPACEDAAHRLAQAANECIEPSLPGLEVRGIVTQADGAGVIVLRTGRSRSAPHRLTSTKECYVRVRDQTLPMSMRQIQDLTFNVARGLEAVDRRFSALREEFIAWTGTANREGLGERRWFLHVAAVPVGDVALDKVHGVPSLVPSTNNRRIRCVPDGPLYLLAYPVRHHMWRPTLRGTESEDWSDFRGGRIGAYRDGSIRYDCIVGAPAAPNRGRDFQMYPGWYFAVVVNAVESANRLRVEAGAAAVEYALEIELRTVEPLPVLRWSDEFYDAAGAVPAPGVRFPRYVFGPTDSWRESYRQVYHDFWNSIGVDTSQDELILLDA